MIIMGLMLSSEGKRLAGRSTGHNVYLTKRAKIEVADVSLKNLPGVKVHAKG